MKLLDKVVLCCRITREFEDVYKSFKKNPFTTMATPMSLRFKKSVDYKLLNEGEPLLPKTQRVHSKSVVLNETFTVERIISRKCTPEVSVVICLLCFLKRYHGI